MFWSLKGRGKYKVKEFYETDNFWASPKCQPCTTKYSATSVQNLGLKPRNGEKMKTNTEPKAKIESRSTLLSFKERETHLLRSWKRGIENKGAKCGVKECVLSPAARDRNLTSRICLAARAKSPAINNLNWGKNTCLVWCHSPILGIRRTCPLPHLLIWQHEVMLYGKTVLETTIRETHERTVSLDR